MDKSSLMVCDSALLRFGLTNFDERHQANFFPEIHIHGGTFEITRRFQGKRDENDLNNDMAWDEPNRHDGHGLNPPVE